VPYERDKLPACHFSQPLRDLSRSKIVFVTFPGPGTDGRYGMVTSPGCDEETVHLRISDFVFKLGDGTGTCGLFAVNARLALLPLPLDLNHEIHFTECDDRRRASPRHFFVHVRAIPGLVPGAQSGGIYVGRYQFRKEIFQSPASRHKDRTN
jgi:hypothetical protein